MSRAERFKDACGCTTGRDRPFVNSASKGRHVVQMVRPGTSAADARRVRRAVSRRDGATPSSASNHATEQSNPQVPLLVNVMLAALLELPRSTTRPERGA